MKASKESGRKTTHRLRCAIYTRKSSEEGLEQDFNSLDAQREACAAFIKSQQHEGWRPLPEVYDDGGYSGGTMERPAIRRLLTEIEKGNIDIVVVYKVDRLTRSLMDFAKIVGLFDQHRVSFVSVTQQFNTTTSMGRLTLNVLLSFAQFERELTGERIRDKIAASKRKGMWMGGNPPLGYDVKERKLVINDKEAETVQDIFERYVALGSVRALKTELDAHGITSKRRVGPSGRETGGRPLGRGALYRMLQNRIYLGQIVHKDEYHPGNHSAIIEESLWNTAQQKLLDHRVAHEGRAENPSLLTGFLFDSQGRRLTPTHSVKPDGRRYRYYTSQPLTTNHGERDQAIRLPAAELERIIKTRIYQLLVDPAALLDILRQSDIDETLLPPLLQRAVSLVADWDSLPGPRVGVILRTFISRIEVHDRHLMINVAPEQVTYFLQSQNNVIPDRPDAPHSSKTKSALYLPLRVETDIFHSRRGQRIIVNGTSSTTPDDSLVSLIVQAQALKNKWLAGNFDIKTLANAEGLNASWITRVLRLAFLAPDIVEAILKGRHPAKLCAHHLVKQSVNLPLDWSDQRAFLGFPSRSA